MFKKQRAFFVRLALPAMMTAILIGSGLAGCSQEPSDVGVVARVNGKPIFLEQLEAKYDLSHLGWSGTVSPSLGKLKADYNRILSELIAQELIFQVLDEKGMPVTRDELLQAEATVRADYPKGMFEQVLVEEYIDLDVWREQLRAHLAYNKLLEKILRPRVTVEPWEIEDYYKAHIDQYNVPSRIRFLLVTGPDKDTVAAAVAHYEKNHDAEAFAGEFPTVKLQEMRVLEDRLTRKWQGALAGVAEGEGSEALSAQSGAEALILLERTPAHQLSPQEAATMIEKQLMERKLQKAFTDWLENELAGADIFVSQQLVTDGDDAEEPAQEEVAPAEEPTAPGSEAPLGDEAPMEEGDAVSPGQNSQPAPSALENSGSGSQDGATSGVYGHRGTAA